MFVLVNMSGLLATKMSLRGKKLVRSALLKRRGVVPPATEEDMNTTGIRVIGTCLVDRETLTLTHTPGWSSHAAAHAPSTSIVD